MIKPHKKRIKIIIKTALEEFQIIKADQIKNLERITMEISLIGGKIKVKRIGNYLDEFEMNELEAKINTEIKILENKENRARKTIKFIEKSKSKLREMETIKTPNILANTLSVLVEEIKEIHIRYRKICCKSQY